jgi:hypothetical protein
MSKPRHKQRQHRLVVPLMGATYDTKALELHLYVENAVTAPSFATLETISIRLGAITAAVFAIGGPLPNRRDPDANAIRQMEAALLSIQDRFDRVGTWGLSGDEAQAMRIASGVLDGTIKQLPFNVLRNAERMVDQIVATMDAERIAALFSE